MKKVSWLLFYILLTHCVSAQDFQKIIRTYDSSSGASKSMYCTPKYHFIFNSFIGFNAGTDTLRPIASPDTSLNHTFITVLDTADKLVSSFTISTSIGVNRSDVNGTGSNSVYFITDSSFLFLASLNVDIYLNGLLILGKVVKHTFLGQRLIKVDKNGVATLVTNIDVTSSGNPDNNSQYLHPQTSSRLSPDKQFYYIIYNTPYNFDSTVYDTTMFRPGMSSILKYNIATGQLAKNWLVSNVFDRIDIVGNDLFLKGFSAKIKPSYTVDTTTYLKDTADKSTYDNVVASFNMLTNKYNWHTIIKSNYNPGMIKVINNMPYISFMYKDTIRLKGQLYGSGISNTVYYLFTSFNQNGQINWAKTIKNGSIYEINSYRDNDVWLTLYSGTSGGANVSDFRYDGLYYPKMIWGSNLVNIDPANGNIKISFPSTFIKPNGYSMTGQYANANDSIIYTIYSLKNTDSLLINGTYYTKRNKNIYFHDYIIVKLKSFTPVKPIKSLTLKPNGVDRMLISWVPDSSYDKNSMSIVVIVKQDSAIKQGPNTIDPIYFQTNDHFSGYATPYQTDSLAKCMYVGDTNQVLIYGLNQTTNYHVCVYDVRDFDYVYSAPLMSSVKTYSPYVAPISGISITPGVARTAKISWTKPTDYNNEDRVTVLFLKADLPFTKIDSPFVGYPFYLADSRFKQGDAYITDSNAYCVFKGDTNSILVQNIDANKTYYAMGYVVREPDTINSITAKGSAFISAPPLDTLLAFKLNAPINNSIVQLEGNANTSIVFNWLHAPITVSSIPRKYSIQLDTTGNFNAPFYQSISSNIGLDSIFSLPYGTLSNLLKLTPAKSMNIKWRVKATANSFIKYSDTFSLNLNRGTFTNLVELENERQIIIYPNPSDGLINLEGMNGIGFIEIYDPLGRIVKSDVQELSEQIDLMYLPNNIYTLRVIQNEKVFMKRFVLKHL